MSTATKKVGRKSLGEAISVRMSATHMPILIRFRQTMELDQGRRISDREALDSLLKSVDTTFNSQSE